MKPTRTAGVLCIVALAACGGHQLEDLERYVAELEVGAGPPLAPLPEFARPAPVAYLAGSGHSPFEPLAFGADPSAQHRAGGVVLDLSRAKQPLEAFSASALVMVGTIAQDAVRWGLVVDADGRVHKVRAGDYLGRDHGRVQRVGEAAIEFVEILPDGGGGWRQRNRRLALAAAVN